MFPINDQNWLDVSQFIQSNFKSNDSIIAPSEFKEVLKNCCSYQENSGSANFKWFVLHKGWIDRLDGILFQELLDRMNPVYANSVFVIFSTHEELKIIDRVNLHLVALLEQLKSRHNPDRQVDKSVAIEQNTLFDLREIGRMKRNTLESLCRNACQTTYLGNDTVLCRVLTKYFCYVDATDISLTPHLLLNGYWEIWITQLLSRTIESGWNCIDIGANCGYYTLLIADLVGNSGRVLAVEPNPRLASLVEQSVRVNGFKSYTTISNLAASNRSNENIQLCVPEGLLGDATIHYPDKLNPKDSSSQYFSITTTTIDELVKDWSHVDFIKIDAEGAELLIWQGMQETLSKNHKLTIIIEFSNYRPTYYDPREFLTEIVNAGFSLNRVNGDSMIQSITFEECLAHENRFIDLALIR